MKKLILSTLFICISLHSVTATSSVIDEIAQLEANKGQRFSNKNDVSSVEETHTIKEKALMPMALSNGQVINVNDYKLVLFMQNHCQYCARFDPLFRNYTSGINFPVWVYTLDGLGDVSFPDAIPAPPEVVSDFKVAHTPTIYLVNVNTMMTYPITDGEQTIDAISKQLDSMLIVDNARR